MSDGATEVELNQAKKSPSAAIGEWSALCGALGFMVGAGVLLYQGYLWLKTGQWESMPFHLALTHIGFDYYDVTPDSWLGLQKLVHWFFNLPLSLMAVILGYLIGLSIGKALATFGEWQSKNIS